MRRRPPRPNAGAQYDPLPPGPPGVKGLWALARTADRPPAEARPNFRFDLVGAAWAVERLRAALAQPGNALYENRRQAEDAFRRYPDGCTHAAVGYLAVHRSRKGLLISAAARGKRPWTAPYRRDEARRIVAVDPIPADALCPGGNFLIDTTGRVARPRLTLRAPDPRGIRAFEHDRQTGAIVAETWLLDGTVFDPLPDPAKGHIRRFNAAFPPGLKYSRAVFGKFDGALFTAFDCDVEGAVGFPGKLSDWRASLDRIAAETRRMNERGERWPADDQG